MATVYECKRDNCADLLYYEEEWFNDDEGYYEDCMICDEDDNCYPCDEDSDYDSDGDE